MAIDAFLFDRYLQLQSKSSHLWHPHHSLLTVLGVRHDVHDNSVATSFAHAPYMQHAGGNTKLNARAQCIEISIPKRDGHTYIHTDAKRDAKQDLFSCLALRRSAIIYWREASESTKLRTKLQSCGTSKNV